MPALPYILCSKCVLEEFGGAVTSPMAKGVLIPSVGLVRVNTRDFSHFQISR